MFVRSAGDVAGRFRPRRDGSAGATGLVQDAECHRLRLPPGDRMNTKPLGVAGRERFCRDSAEAKKPLAEQANCTISPRAGGTSIRHRTRSADVIRRPRVGRRPCKYLCQSRVLGSKARRFQAPRDGTRKTSPGVRAFNTVIIVLNSVRATPYRPAPPACRIMRLDG